MPDFTPIENGSINRAGGFDAADYRPTGFHLGEGNAIFKDYTPVGRIDSAGNIRGAYDSLTEFRIDHGVVIRDVR